MLIFIILIVLLCVVDAIIAKFTIVPGFQERNLLRVFFGLAAMLGTLLIAYCFLLYVFMASA